MKSWIFFLLRLALAPLLFAGGGHALGQEAQLVLEPPLRDAFPLQITPQGVCVAYPVLLNEHTILRPAAVLRFIYIDANPEQHQRGGGGDRGSGFRSHVTPGGGLAQGNDDIGHGDAAGGWGPPPGDLDAGIFDDNKKEDAKRSKQELQSERWTQPDLFREAFDHATDLGTTVVYNLPAQNRPLTAAFDLPEGMLLAEEKGQVRVLGLDPHSRAYAAGIRAGDAICSINGGANLGTLADFLHEYAASKHRSGESGNGAYVMAVRQAGSDQVVSVQMAAPPSIPSFL